MKFLRENGDGHESQSKGGIVTKATIAAGIAAITGYVACSLPRGGLCEEPCLNGQGGMAGSGGILTGGGGTGGIIEGGSGGSAGGVVGGEGGIGGSGGTGGVSEGGTGGIGGMGGTGGVPEGGSGGQGGAGLCDPTDPDTIMITSDDECFKAMQFTDSGSTIVQEGSTPDSVACQPTPFCMKNLHAGDFGFITVKNTVNGSITADHMAPFKNPGLYGLCVNDYSVAPGPTQTEMRNKFMSGGYNALAANPGDNPVTLVFTCPQNDWVAYRLDIGP